MSPTTESQDPVNPFLQPASTLPCPAAHGYSRHDEEPIIQRYFQLYPPKHSQRLVDFGAWVGDHFSNSWALVERGWNAALVDPSASAIVQLIKLCRGRKNVRLVQAYVVGGTESIHASTLTVLQHTADAFSTTNPAVYAANRTTTKDYFPVMVPTLKVKDFLLAFPGPFDFVTLTTGGESESAAIMAYLLSHASVSLFAVEHCPGGVDMLPLLRAMAQAKGYHLLALNQDTAIFGEQPWPADDVAAKAA